MAPEASATPMMICTTRLRSAPRVAPVPRKPFIERKTTLLSFGPPKSASSSVTEAVEVYSAVTITRVELTEGRYCPPQTRMVSDADHWRMHEDYTGTRGELGPPG